MMLEPKTSPRILFRVDPRLIHATFTNAWVPHLDARLVVIADDKVTRDPRRRAILELSAAEPIRVLFSSEEQVHDEMSKFKQDGNVIVLFCALDNALRAARAGLKIPTLDIGHIPEAPERQSIRPAIFMGPHEFEIVEKITAMGTKICARALPTDQPLWLPLAKTPDEPSQAQSSPIARSSSSPDVHERAEGTVLVVNERGLHLRAAHVLAHEASQWEANISLGPEGNLVNAKSLLGLTTLGAGIGTKLKLVIVGPRAKESFEAIAKLFETGFGESLEQGPVT